MSSELIFSEPTKIRSILKIIPDTPKTQLRSWFKCGHADVSRRSWSRSSIHDYLLHLHCIEPLLSFTPMGGIKEQGWRS